MTEGKNEQAASAPVHAFVHTPGPWMVFPRVGPSHNCTVAGVFIPPTGDQKANARLIAKSPDLIEFVKCFVHEWEATWIDPDDVNHEWSHLYRLAKELIREVNGGHSV
jgi:hypothetical protein